MITFSAILLLGDILKSIQLPKQYKNTNLKQINTYVVAKYMHVRLCITTKALLIMLKGYKHAL